MDAMTLKLGMRADWATGSQVQSLSETVDQLAQSIRSTQLSVQPGLIDVESIALDGSGDGTLEYENNNAASVRVVRRLSVLAHDASAVPSSTGSVLAYVGVAFLAKLSAGGETLDLGQSPVVLRRGMRLRFVWDGADASDSALMSIFYDRVLETEG